MDINRIIEREKQFIESICNTYQYDNNLRHILLLLIPTFILKYGIEKEQLIKNTFQSTRIIPSNEESKMIRAYYVSTPYKDLIKMEKKSKHQKEWLFKIIIKIV